MASRLACEPKTTHRRGRQIVRQECDSNESTIMQRFAQSFQKEEQYVHVRQLNSIAGARRYLSDVSDRFLTNLCRSAPILSPDFPVMNAWQLHDRRDRGACRGTIAPDRR